VSLVVGVIKAPSFAWLTGQYFNRKENQAKQAKKEAEAKEKKALRHYHN